MTPGRICCHAMPSSRSACRQVLAMAAGNGIVIQLCLELIDAILPDSFLTDLILVKSIILRVRIVPIRPQRCLYHAAAQYRARKILGGRKCSSTWDASRMSGRREVGGMPCRAGAYLVQSVKFLDTPGTHGSCHPPSNIRSSTVIGWKLMSIIAICDCSGI